MVLFSLNYRISVTDNEARRELIVVIHVSDMLRILKLNGPLIIKVAVSEVFVLGYIQVQ